MSTERESVSKEVDRWVRVYADLLRIERHWTEQVQNQQQRIATILTMNAFLLGLLVAAGLAEGVPQRSWPAYVFLGALIILSLALVLGILALRPRIRIPGTGIGAVRGILASFRPTTDQPLEDPATWLNAQRTLDVANAASEVEALRELCASVVENQAIGSTQPRYAESKTSHVSTTDANPDRHAGTDSGPRRPAVRGLSDDVQGNS